MAVSRPSTTFPRHRHRRVATVHPRAGRSPLRTRDWRVRTKLVAVLVVPALAFVFVAGLQTSLSVRQAATLSELADQVALGAQVSALVHELQFERDRVGGELAALAAAPVGARDRTLLGGSLANVRDAVRNARASFDAAASRLRDRPALGPAIAEATAALDELAVVHAGLAEGWLREQAVFDGYTRAIEALLALLRAPSTAEDSEVRGYQDLAEVKEINARIRGHVFAMANAGRVTPGAIEQLANARAQRTAARERFRANATAPQLARFDEVVRGQAVRGSARLEQAVLEQAVAGALDVDPEQWWAASTTELELIREVESTLLAEAHARVAEGSQVQWRQTGLVTGATVLILLISLLTSVGIGRSMARSLRRLRDQAMEVAHIQLPGLLARLRASRGAVPAVEEVAQISAGGADEVGDVADAFTQVHHSAVQLAVEQAVMRRNVNSIFVNLARRSQVLVERQLELLDDLERDETEPTQLKSLFRLDHLATRMRRNNESLLVLTGTDGARPYHRPVPLAAVTLAAIAEIEQYQRVREDVAEDLHVVGSTVSDLVHLLAELLDNATSFSARDTTVAIIGRWLPGPGGALVEVTDSGLGMSPTALGEANALLAAPPVIDVAASERMGLVVVGHLAARHGIRVHLAATASGTRASVWLPANLLSAAPADAEPLPVRMAALTQPVPEAGRRVVRAEDVLATVAEADQPSTWWSPPAQGSTTTGTTTGTTAGAGGGQGTATATLLAPAPSPRVGGTSSGGLPIRVPQAQLPGGAGPPGGGQAAGNAAGNGGGSRRSTGGWHAGDPDPEQVGSTLSRFYSGVRRAESETVAEPEIEPEISPENEPENENETEPSELGGVDGEPEQGST